LRSQLFQLFVQCIALRPQFRLRKLRRTDKRRGKGKRGGLRVIYFYWVRGLEFWLFTLYDKNELSDLSKKDRTTLESLLKIELKMRK
jgi:hypothetical protein